VLAGAPVPLGVAVFSVPTSVFGGRHPHTGVQAAIFAIELAAVAVIAPPMLVRQKQQKALQPNGFVRLFGTIYLVVLAAL
jgi:hypothetical protein